MGLGPNPNSSSRNSAAFSSGVLATAFGAGSCFSRQSTLSDLAGGGAVVGVAPPPRSISGASDFLVARRVGVDGVAVDGGATEIHKGTDKK